MRSRGVRAVLLAFLAGVVTLLVVAATDQRELAFSLAVRASEPGILLQSGQEACQHDIDVEVPFDRVTLLLATYFQPGPRLEFRVLDHSSGTVVATGVLPDGYPDSKISGATLSRLVPTGRHVDICMKDVGPRRVALFSGPGTDNEPSYATLDGRPIQFDILIDFIRPHRRSALSLIPDMFDRAALFHPRWVGAWTFWLLAAVLLVAVPALLCRAVRAAGQGRP